MRQNVAFIHSARYKSILSISYGIFLYVFLMLFLPFGVSNYDPNHEYTFNFLLELSIFIPVTIIGSLLNEFLIKSLFGNRTSFAFFLGWTLWSLIFLGLLIFVVYNYLGNWHDWYLASLPGFLFNTATVLIFPTIALFFFYRHKTLREEYDAILTNTGTGIDENLMLNFTGEGSKDRFSVSVKDFIFAQAQDNYIEIYYVKNNVSSKFLIRSSLGKLHKSLSHEFLIRCHRSYVINLYNVHSIKGNRKDLKISMSHTDTTIPVSHTYMDVTLDALVKYKQFQ